MERIAELIHGFAKRYRGVKQTAERFDRRRDVDATIYREFASGSGGGTVSASAVAIAIGEDIHRAYIEVMISSPATALGFAKLGQESQGIAQ